MTGDDGRRRYLCSGAPAWGPDTVFCRWGRRWQGGWRRNGASGTGHRVAVRQCLRERPTGRELGHRRHARRGGEYRDLPVCEPGGERVERVAEGAVEPYRVDVATIPSPSRPWSMDGRSSGLHDSEGEHQGSGEDRGQQNADRSAASVILSQLCSRVVCPIWRRPHDLRGRPITSGGSSVPTCILGRRQIGKVGGKARSGMRRETRSQEPSPRSDAGPEHTVTRCRCSGVSHWPR
jgi:hypothetical protein